MGECKQKHTHFTLKNTFFIFQKFTNLSHQIFTMSLLLMHYMSDEGEKVYTLKKTDPEGKPTVSAHPARFSPEDKYSKQRIVVKKRFGLLLTQQPKTVM